MQPLPPMTAALTLPPRLLCWAPARVFAVSEPPGLGLEELRKLPGRLVAVDVAAHYDRWVGEHIAAAEQQLWHRYCLRRVSGAPAGSTADAQGTVVGSLLAVLAADQWLGPGDSVFALEQWAECALREWHPQREQALERVAENEAPWDDDDDGDCPPIPVPSPADLDAASAASRRVDARADRGLSEIAVLERRKLDAYERCDFDTCKELQARIEQLSAPAATAAAAASPPSPAHRDAPPDIAIAQEQQQQSASPLSAPAVPRAAARATVERLIHRIRLLYRTHSGGWGCADALRTARRAAVPCLLIGSTAAVYHSVAGGIATPEQ